MRQIVELLSWHSNEIYGIVMIARFCFDSIIVTILYFIPTFFCGFCREAYACPDIDKLVDVNCDGQLKIVCFGDSITYGIRDSENIGYPGRLQRLLPGSVILNEGVPGETSDGGRGRAYELFTRVIDVDYVIILEGTNDYWLKSRNAFWTADNIESISTMARKGGAIPLIGTLLPSFRSEQYLWIKDVNNLIESKTDIDFFELGSQMLSWDQLHPDDEGYEKMAELVFHTLRGMASKIRPKDFDKDGVYDFEEGKYKTNKTKQDSDLDGLTDAEEIYKYSTDPTKPDSDGDGLWDSFELKKLHTNPKDSRPSAPKIVKFSIQP